MKQSESNLPPFPTNSEFHYRVMSKTIEYIQMLVDSERQEDFTKLDDKHITLKELADKIQKLKI